MQASFDPNGLIPYGVAVDLQDNVFVADTGQNQVKKVPCSNGSYGSPVTIGPGFNHPVAIAVDAEGLLYTVDSKGLSEFVPLRCAAVELFFKLADTASLVLVRCLGANPVRN